MNDLISRQDAVDALDCINGTEEVLRSLPPARPDMSKDYAKAVRTWLVQYQIECAKLEGRYTPYEVLSWIVEDWGKDNEI